MKRLWIRLSAGIARRLAATGAVFLFAVAGASACPICFSGRVVTIGQQLDAADQAVLAVPAPDGERFRIIAVVKGDATAGGTIAMSLNRAAASALPSAKPLLLLRNALGQHWTSVGNIGIEYADWLRQLAATANTSGGSGRPTWPLIIQPASELTDVEWRQRVALVEPYLEHPEPLAAEIAFGEIARAPYPALRALKGRLKAMAVATWIDDPKLAVRRATYMLLIGIVGGSDDAARLERHLDAAGRSRDATNLAAMLAADLELRGPARVGWIETVYFADRERTMPEIEAALLALSIHGGASGVVPRERVIEAYRLFIREHKPMAGFVAQELADWGYWDATPEYVALLRSDAVKDPASHFEVVNYLQRSPRPAAKAALRSLAEEAK
jgi:hypothetical protein